LRHLFIDSPSRYGYIGTLSDASSFVDADRIGGSCHAGPPIRVVAKRSQPLED
jgi:hypothetical protein